MRISDWSSDVCSSDLGFRRRAIGRADVDGAVLLDGDVGARGVLDRVDRLALGADELADLVDRDLHADHARSGRGHLIRTVDRGVEHAEDRQSRLVSLLQRGGEQRRRDAVKLRVELDRGDRKSTRLYSSY